MRPTRIRIPDKDRTRRLLSLDKCLVRVEVDSPERGVHLFPWRLPQREILDSITRRKWSKPRPPPAASVSVALAHRAPKRYAVAVIVTPHVATRPQHFIVRDAARGNPHGQPPAQLIVNQLGSSLLGFQSHAH
jgi:hypothetical protein